MPFRIFLCTLPNGFFGNAGRSWKSLDLKIFCASFARIGATVEVVSVDKILNCDLRAQDIVFYTSSDEPNVRSYIKDVMYIVNKKAKLVPSYESLLAHENKGFQQLIREERNFGNLRGGYHYDLERLPNSVSMVFKCIYGAGSSKVSLVESERDVDRVRRRYFSLGVKRKLIKSARKVRLRKREYALYSYRHKGFSQYAFQEYIPGLDHDYKVLIFGTKYYVLRRNVRKNDFRASGSGDFLFSDPPVQVLEYAREVFSIIDEPFASLDIAKSPEMCHLIEYQVLNFGPTTFLGASGFYSRTSSGKWKFEESVSTLEDVYAESLCNYLAGRESNDARN